MQPNINDEVSNNAVLDYMELHQHLSEKVEEEAKIDFITFVRLMAPKLISDWKMGKHIEVISEKLKKLEKKLVLCAKQSLNYFNNICDFHMVSTYNYQPYKYENPNTIKSWQLTAMNMQNELNTLKQGPACRAVEGRRGKTRIKK